MTTPKKTLTSADQQLLVFKALADPIRLEIIQYLKQVEHEVACGEVGQAIQISKTSGSYHFKLLAAAQLITTHKVAREKYVSLNLATFERYVTDFYQNI
ncbi:ArsR/SmtB family transcription factor [Lapidilactobacillus wuchangensis]|uniref:ArsR/SmtB family transcription factor n=1 Tax=Lapidilactobacillus wuchangensis TaxID=2486001 RepID=UPI000F7951FF|nr:helix-turn-helix domain-containing protein [Lapidilactobacillus wuchangensis]